MWYWILDLMLKIKLRLESWNWKIQYGCQAAIWIVTLLKINKLLSIATNNTHMEFENGIPKQTWVRLQKTCRLQTDRRTDRWTDGQDDSSIPPLPPPPPPPTPPPPTTTTSLGWGIKTVFLDMELPMIKITQPRDPLSLSWWLIRGFLVLFL